MSGRNEKQIQEAPSGDGASGTALATERGRCAVCGKRRQVGYRGWTDDDTPMLTCNEHGTPWDEEDESKRALVETIAQVDRLTARLSEAEERFAAMKQRVEASHSTPAYRRHHETWQEAADRLMRERDGETLRATAALARLSETERERDEAQQWCVDEAEKHDATKTRLARAEARLSEYEQARDVLNEWRHGSDWIGEGSGQMPDRVAILRLEEILFPARAALSGSTRQPWTWTADVEEAEAGDAASGASSGGER